MGLAAAKDDIAVLCECARFGEAGAAVIFVFSVLSQVDRVVAELVLV